MNRKLIVVDMQNDFVDGALGTKEAEAIVDSVVDKITGYEGEVIFTYDTHTRDYLNTQEGKNLPVEHCVEGTHGWTLNSKVDEQAKGRKKFTKPTFGSRELAEYLAKEEEKDTIDEIELIGLCTDICVISNALVIKAFLPETRIIVDSYCCAGVTPDSHGNALEAMKACQVDVR